MRRGRGERAGLSIATIVDAARTLAPDGVTMQAVADKLGVDRKALSNHVVDRDDLLARVAAEAVSTHLGTIPVAGDIPWQLMCRTYARGLAAAVTEIGTLSRHFRWETPHPALLAPAERAINCLLVAGFDDETAARALSMLTTLAVAYAQNRTSARRDIDDPLSGRLRRSIEGCDDGTFHSLECIIDSDIRTYDNVQLELMIEIFIAGVEKRQP